MSFDIAKRFSDGLVDRSLSSCTRWAEKRIRMGNPFPGPINFDRFPWEKEILDINEGFVTVKKAAQMGFSIAGIIRALFVVSELSNDVLYVLPTQGLASDFSKSRFDALVELSPRVNDLFKNINSVGLKVTNKRANLYIRGSVSSRGLVSVPVSSAIIDEFDRCADGTYDLVSERLSGQLTKYLFALSTPTLPEFGIDKHFLSGTRESFFFKCPSCGRHETLTWPDNVEIRGDYPGDPECDNSFYKCSQCQAKLPHETKMEWLRSGTWVPERTNVKGHRSFQIPQLFSTTVKPGEMVDAYQKSLLSDLAAVEFKNQKLGQPHISEGARLSDSIIQSCYNTSISIGSDRPADASQTICMGVDVGSFLDCWIAKFDYVNDPGRFPYENSKQTLLHTCRIPTTTDGCWNQLDNLMREWQVHYACVDFQPSTVNARRFVRTFKGYAAMVAYRRGTAGKEIKEMDDEGALTLTVDRTTFLDLVIGRFQNKTIDIPGNIPGVVREHLKAPIRTYEYDELGLPKPVYKSIADDHFAHAAAYCEIAHLKSYTRSTGRVIEPGEKI